MADDRTSPQPDDLAAPAEPVGAAASNDGTGQTTRPQDVLDPPEPEPYDEDVPLADPPRSVL